MRLRQVTWVIMVVALAGCGTATALPSTGHDGHDGHRAATGHDGHPGGPPSSTRPASLRLARQVISKNVLPPGARRLPQRPIPPRLRQHMSALGVTYSVDVYRLFALPVTMRQAASFLARHAPAGMGGQGTGTSGGPGGITEMDVSYFLNKPPRGISSAELTDTVVPARHGAGRHGRSLLREDVEVIWYPPRSAAEQIDQREYRAVKVDAWLYGHRVRHVVKTFSEHGVIGRLARLINNLPAFPGGFYNCPLELATDQLTFEPVAGHPAIVVYTGGCASDTVTVGGLKQPDLSDFGKLLALVGKIMHVSQPRLAARR